MRHLMISAAFIAAFAGAAQAQDRARTILVLDGSGSMWGQIDGTTKIEIAQSVVGDLLGTLPADQELGLTVYGHRRKGDCSDIETIVAPGTGTRDAITSAVQGVTPRGKTPLTDAVVAAAEALKYTEEAATVILVSDGRETCEADPCAVGRQLEETGVNFTTHVVGFDVAGDEAARAELQCLADETGGQFLMAGNAAELGAALAEVADEPIAIPVTLRAIAGEGGPEIETPLMWDITGSDGPIVEFERGARLVQDLLPGEYTASVLRPEDEASVDKSFVVANTATTVTLVLPAPLPEATLEAADTAVMGATIPVTWDGPDTKNDYIAVSDPAKGRYINYAYTRDGNPAQVQMPPKPGTYELRYYRGDNTVLATRAITVTPLDVTILGADTGMQGATIPVEWTGPDYKNDYISVAARDDGARYINYRYTRDGTPAQLQLPPEPGEYNLHYIMAQNDTVLATQPITVTAVEASVSGPATVTAGAQVPVEWVGPDYKNDYIAISKVGDNRYETYTYTREGAGLTVKAPLETGSYELRYVMAQDNTVLAVQPLEVADVTASLDALDRVDAGAKLLVTFDGPAYKNDYISIAEVGSDDKKYLTYTYTRDGSPLTVRTPPVPGSYELRYVVTGKGAQVLVRQPLELTAPQLDLIAKETAVVRTRLAVQWSGPNQRSDRIELIRQGETKVYAKINTQDNSPAVITLPEGPGQYELRYVAGQKNHVLATKPLTLTLE